MNIYERCIPAQNVSGLTRKKKEGTPLGKAPKIVKDSPDQSQGEGEKPVGAARTVPKT